MFPPIRNVSLKNRSINFMYNTALCDATMYYVLLTSGFININSKALATKSSVYIQEIRRIDFERLSIGSTCHIEAIVLGMSLLFYFICYFCLKLPYREI